MHCNEREYQFFLALIYLKEEIEPPGLTGRELYFNA
jgi:hypothetical protein